jgi:hypothetical protein
MIDQEKLAGIKTLMRGNEAPKDPLAGLSAKELRRLRGEIDKLLPSSKVSDLNLEEELVEQYQKIKDLMDEVTESPDVGASQKAQVGNSVVGTLGQLVKLQEDLRRQETFKIMEGVLIEAIKRLPAAVKDEFFTEYARLAKRAGLT